MSSEDKFRYLKINSLTDDGWFIFEDGSSLRAIVGSTDTVGPAFGEPCALKMYIDLRGWKHQCLCRFPPEEGDTLFIMEHKRMKSKLLEGEKLVWSNWDDTRIVTVKQLTPREDVQKVELRYPMGYNSLKLVEIVKNRWTVVDKNYGYKEGTGSLQIVKNSNGEFTIGYDAAALAEGEQPDYVVRYFSSIEECEEYAKEEGYK